MFDVVIHPIMDFLVVNIIYIWANYNISPSCIKAIKGNDFPKINHDSQ